VDEMGDGDTMRFTNAWCQRTGASSGGLIVD
jgi:hypothetical protein